MPLVPFNLAPLMEESLLMVISSAQVQPIWALVVMVELLRSLLVRPMAKSKLVVIFPALVVLPHFQAAMVALLAPLMFRPSTPPLQSTAQPSLPLVVSLKKVLLVFKVLAARLRLLPLFRLERRRHRLALVPQSETLFSTEHLIPPPLRILN